MKVWYQPSLVLTKSPDFFAWWGFLYECPHEIPSTSSIRKLQFMAGLRTPAVCQGHPVCSQSLPGKQNSRGHGGDVATWWCWCLSGCLSRKFSACVTQVYLAGNTWAQAKSISGEKPQAGHLCFVRISPSSSDCLFYNLSTCVKDNTKANTEMLWRITNFQPLLCCQCPQYSKIHLHVQLNLKNSLWFLPAFTHLKRDLSSLSWLSSILLARQAQLEGQLFCSWNESWPSGKNAALLWSKTFSLHKTFWGSLPRCWAEFEKEICFLLFW